MRKEDQMAHRAAVVANKFLSLAKQAGQTLTPMQLLKLVYLAHGWTLGLYRRPLISDPIEAWKYGPVIPTLYNEIRSYRSDPVSQPILGFHDTLSSDEDAVVQRIYDIYGGLSGPALSRLTHAPGTPWSQTYEPLSFGERIPNDVIQDYYVQRVKS